MENQTNLENCPPSLWIYLFLAWLVAAIAFVGSLFFSLVMEFIPCELCWYQRILMYPLVLTLGTGLFPLDKEAIKYSAPLVFLGWPIALYHNLIQWGIISEDLSPCIEGVSCSARYIEWFGFITIPLLSLFAFTLIGVLLYLFIKKLKTY